MCNHCKMGGCRKRRRRQRGGFGFGDALFYSAARGVGRAGKKVKRLYGKYRKQNPHTRAFIRGMAKGAWRQWKKI